MAGIKKYTVVLLFDREGKEILLQKKDHTAFAGRLNGVGGKVEDGEIPEKCARRETFEETSLRQDDIKCLTWLGTLTLPYQCDEREPGTFPELWFFAGVVENKSLAVKPADATEEIAWYELDDNGKPVTHGTGTAGDGDLEYFIKSALRMLFGKQV